MANDVLAAAGVTRRPRPRLRGRYRWLLLGAAAALIAGTGAAFLAANSTVVDNITAGGMAGSGLAATVTPVSNTFTVATGNAEQIAGLELYRIDLGTGVASDHVVGHFLWLDPQDADRLLNNPNAWIQVGLYDPAGTWTTSSACAGGQTALTDPVNGNVCAAPDPGTQASAQLTAASADSVLVSSVAGKSTLYVLGAITTPGHVPQGQQGNLTGLQYYMDVKVH